MGKEETAMSDVVATDQTYSQTWTYFQGAWREGNVAIMGVRTHGAWLGSVIFDGARRFEGVMPDLDLHCARINASAESFHLKPVVSVERWIELVHEGAAKFAPDAALYIRPMYWAENGVGGGVKFDAETTQWCLTLYEAPMPGTAGAAITLSPFRKPAPDVAPIEAKASCLYPNNARALIEAAGRGFDNCILLDALGNVAELANANVFMAKDGVVYTPAPSGAFLNGITRRRTIGLLRGAGVEVVETALKYRDFAEADEIFSAGNFQKVAPVVRIDERHLQQGPLYRRARELYWAFAHGE
jgi:branched-chain amino acid aminotransferase